MDAIILAGGFGTRLRPAVSEVPKCMAPVSGKPFLWYLLKYLEGYPVERVVLSLGYLHEVVEEWVSRNRWPFKVEYSVEDTPLGTGGAIALALDNMGPVSGKVLIINGDTLFNVDLDAFAASADMPVNIALRPMADTSRYGRVHLENGTVMGFREKQPGTSGFINGGVYLINPETAGLGTIPRPFSFERDYLEKICAEDSGSGVGGFVSDTYFLDIGIPEDWARASRELPLLMSVREASRKAEAFAGAVPEGRKPALFLDRDGVINILRPDDYVKSWEEFEFVPGILENLREWAGIFGPIIIVTNQRGVGRGLMPEDALKGIHSEMLSRIREAGGRIDAIYYCTSIDSEDPMRKPGTGMFRRALEDFPEIEPGISVMIGDSDSDALFASRCGMSFIRI